MWLGGGYCPAVLRRWRSFLLGVAPVVLVLVAHSIFDAHSIPLTAVIIGPIVAAATASAAVVGGVSVAAVVAGMVMGLDEGELRSDDAALRLLVVAVVGLTATFIARDREARLRDAARSESFAEMARRLELSLEAGGMGTWVYDAGTGKTTWDERLAAMHGFAAGEYDGRFESWVERVHPEDRHLVLNASDEAIAHRTPYAVAYRTVWRDGTVRWLEARGEPVVEGGRVTGTAGVVVDVTDRMTVATALEESRAEARTVIHQRDALGTTLQGSLLPSPPAELRGIRVTHAYRPGSRHLLVGGDFFDVVEAGGTVRFVIGDVSGHGAVSAAVGVSLRAAWRAAALTLAEPAEWIDLLDNVLRTETDDIECFATVCAGSIEGGTVSIVLAGHPPPILIDATGVHVVEAATAAPVGMHTRTVCTRIEPAQPATLFLYTDGLIEGHVPEGGSERYGIDAVVEWLRTRLGDRVELTEDDVEDLLAEVEAANGARLEDDVALLLLTSRGD